MRVKRLEIQGFKSFKDKTVVHFDHSITGIVGPNGSGKSNIVDAFFWVMGEQSYKHMRGSGSGDLIFNGSSKYNPMGMAEATLVMETDVPDTENAASGASAADLPVQLKTKEVSVTRRVYRSGEGEYFINGVPARLKDVHELFMDTGVGAKGYSVIEQGQIGKIVQAKPEERRLLIEEAAGIAKYKARKKESLRKMEATQGNLSRLNDVIAEIERNLSSLERQATKARQYKKYKEELLDKEMTWGRRKTQVLRQKLDQLKKDREVLEQDLIVLKAELQTAENTIEVDRVDQVTDTKLAEELQASIQDMNGELHRERSALELSRRRQGDLAEQLEQLENERQTLEISIGEEREKLSAKDSESHEAEVAFQAARDQVEAVAEQVRSAREVLDTERRNLDQAKRELMSGITQSSDLTSRAAALRSKAESARAQADRLAQQSASLSERIAVTRDESETSRAQAEEARTQKESLQAERKELASRIQDQEQATRQADRERDESSKTLTQHKSRLQSLEELAAAHEGFGDGPKAALDWARESGSGDQLRAIADALDVKKGFEAALEGWLEGGIENLVSEDAALASTALNQIRGEKQGRAAIHLAAERAGASADWAAVSRILEKTGFKVSGKLADFVKCNAKLGAGIKAIAESSVRDVAVVESMDGIAEFLAQGGLAKLGGWSIVDLAGMALSSGGVLRGGSSESNEAASLLGRKRAIADLTEQVQEAEAAFQALEKKATDLRQSLELSRARSQTLQSELQEVEIRSATLERDVHQISRTLRDLESQLESSDLEVESLRAEAEKAESERAEAEAKVASILSSRSDLEGKIGAQEGGLNARETEVRERENELSNLKVGEASHRERSTSLKRELETTRGLIADRERRLGDVVRVLERASKEHTEHSGGDSDLENRIVELTKAIADQQGKLSAVKDRLEQSGAKLKVALSRIKELHECGDSKTSQSNQVAIEIEKIVSEVTHLVQNLEEKYGPGCLERPVTSPIQEEMTDPVVTHEMSAEEEQLLGEEVERLRERIRRLGEVNVGAIEEFEETQKRFEHISKEKLDLERSIENLEDAIEHINKTSEERFKRAFEAIADRFERLFPIIFGGGQAKLTLVFPEGSAGNDILEAGVDILAQPPGKKIQNMTLLSGGEKALTALSFIFAIFMVKPSPFCLLDEVDAPLDDANIGKFNALLREMSVKSQFILITHNKKTMELNDTLYGVTMEEPGVSKIVSIEMH